MQDKAEEEKKRILDLLNEAGLSEKRIAAYNTIIENVSWMKVKLDETRDTIKNSSVAIKYDNGGGQKGIRENPVFKGYESLWKSYQSGMNMIISALPQEAANTEKDKVTEQRTVLEIVRNRRKKEA